MNTSEHALADDAERRRRTTSNTVGTGRHMAIANGSMATASRIGGGGEGWAGLSGGECANEREEEGKGGGVSGVGESLASGGDGCREGGGESEQRRRRQG
jgi:hypothetical protein